MRRFGLIVIVAACSLPLAAAENTIFQYFLPSKTPDARPLSGAYLWVPPDAPKIRAVMVGIHNGLPATILQHPAVRDVCRKQGIAQVLLTPNGSEIGPVMLKGLNFDITNPEKTGIYDGYIAALAEISGHPELATAPTIPLAHSAYASFPMEVALRDPAKCLGIIPIKAGFPDVYKSYGPGGTVNVPMESPSTRGVPMLFLTSSAQETVGWGSFPRTAGPLNAYRKDAAGTGEYEPGNEMAGIDWDMMSGHFDMLPRNFEFVSKWIDAVASLRLPAKPGEALKDLSLADGWLIDARFGSGGAPFDAAPPARYADFSGDRRKALWYPTEALAREQHDRLRGEPTKEIEMFTFLDPDGQPIPLTHGQMAVMPLPERLLRDDGIFTLQTHHFTEPFPVCTSKEKGHEKKPDAVCTLENVVFPGKTTLPVSGIPLELDLNGTALELVSKERVRDPRGVEETRFTLRLKFHRFAPDGGSQLLFPRVYHQGNNRFAASGRTAQLQWWLGGILKDGRDQKIDFPEIPDTAAKTTAIPLAAASSAGLPVSYFVVNGPCVVEGATLVPRDVPAGLARPIEVTVAACQPGRYGPDDRVKPAATVYRTFRLLP